LAVQVPATSSLLKPAPQSLHSPSEASPASDDGSQAARIAALERKVLVLERGYKDLKGYMEFVDGKVILLREDFDLAPEA
jgi:hypothetical protein